MKITTSAHMKQLEQSAADYGTTTLSLMENAGFAAAALINKIKATQGSNVMIFCGKGGNGGDGFVVASKLFQWGAKVVVVLTDGLPTNPDSETVFPLLDKMRIPLLDTATDMDKITGLLSTATIVVDAIYGIGFHGSLSQDHAQLAAAINLSPATVIALDVPSGVDADNAVADPNAVMSDHTIVFECLKPSHLFTKELPCLGTLHTISIGLPSIVYNDFNSDFIQCDNAKVFHYIKPKAQNLYKGSAGKLLNIAGSMGMAGAAVMSTQGALRTGAGYVTLAIHKSLYPYVSSHLVSPVCLLLEQGTELYPLLDAMRKNDAVAFGCGLGREPWVLTALSYLVENCTVPMVIDADGINALSGNISMLQRAGCSIVLTPHMGEFAKLCGISTSEVQTRKLTLAKEFSHKHNVVLVLKGANTIVASPDGLVYVNCCGNPGLAKAGSGDILTGMIASLLAQGIPPYAAAVCGVYLHAQAADRCSRRLSQYYMQPTDILTDLCDIFRENNR